MPLLLPPPNDRNEVSTIRMPEARYQYAASERSPVRLSALLLASFWLCDLLPLARRCFFLCLLRRRVPRPGRRRVACCRRRRRRLALRRRLERRRDAAVARRCRWRCCCRCDDGDDDDDGFFINLWDYTRGMARLLGYTRDTG